MSEHHAATAGELAKFRANNQASELLLYVYTPLSVFSAQINGTPASLDEVTSLTIDNVVGDPADVEDGMTAWVGSASGLRDIGTIRVRSATATTLQIGATSDVQFTDNLYLTVFPEWQIWSRKLTFVDNAWDIEGEITYNDQHTNLDPIPVLGPTIGVCRIDPGGTVDFVMDASDSWSPGQTISSYAWSAIGPDTVTFSDAAAAAPTLTFSTEGVYRIQCAVTAFNGHVATGVRFVVVYNSVYPGPGQPFTQFRLDSCEGSTSEGGWNFRATLYEADLQTIRDQALCVLFRRDWYGPAESDEGSIGPLTSYENIEAIGWIAEDETNWSPEQGLVQISVRGPAWWMNQVGSWPFAILDSESTPTDWVHMQGLTVDKALWAFAYWRSSIWKFMDVRPSGDTRRIFDCSTNIGSLWEQLRQFTSTKIGAQAICDRFGRLWVQIDPQYLALADRDTLPMVQDVTTQDWTGEISIPRRPPTVALLDAEGFAYSSGAWLPILSRASGNAMTRIGSQQKSYGMVFTDQTQANALAGRMYAKQNNPYPGVLLRLASNQTMVDIAPSQYLTLSINQLDTPRGIIWTNQRLVPRRVSRKHDAQTGMMLTEVEGEVESNGPSGVTVTPPPVVPANPPGGPNGPDPFNPPDVPPINPPSSANPCLDTYNLSETGPYTAVFDKSIIYAGQSAVAHCPCTIRKAPGGVSNYPSMVQILATFNGTALTYTHVYAIDASGANILEAAQVNSNTWIFAPASPVAVAGFGISVDPGGGEVKNYGLTAMGTLSYDAGAGFWTDQAILDFYPGGTADNPISVSNITFQGYYYNPTGRVGLIVQILDVAGNVLQTVYSSGDTGVSSPVNTWNSYSYTFAATPAPRIRIIYANSTGAGEARPTDWIHQLANVQLTVADSINLIKASIKNVCP